MLHRYRPVMMRPGGDRPRGNIEVDGSFLGPPEPGVPGRGSLGKVLVAVAVEVEERGFGRARLDVIPDASAVSLAAFLDANEESGSCVITDGWSAYPKRPPGTVRRTGDVKPCL
ncbi:MAG: transposase [Ferrimicrobium sp.]